MSKDLTAHPVSDSTNEWPIDGAPISRVEAADHRRDYAVGVREMRKIGLTSRWLKQGGKSTTPKFPQDKRIRLRKSHVYKYLEIWRRGDSDCRHVLENK
jgi:hypothetical protein